MYPRLGKPALVPFPNLRCATLGKPRAQFCATMGAEPLRFRFGTTELDLHLQDSLKARKSLLLNWKEATVVLILRMAVKVTSFWVFVVNGF